LDVVNRLLDCKEINVNLQGQVSGNVDFVTFYLQNSLSIFFADVFLIQNFGDDKENVV
jgi:hypothetical protein